MLVHMVKGSEGAGADFAKITSKDVDRINFNATCFSGVRFGTDGNLYLIQANGGFSRVSGQWLVNGVSSTFYVTRILDSGTLTTDAGAGPLQLNANRDYDIRRTTIGVKTATVTFEISDDVTGSPILTTATFVLTAEYDSGL